MKILIFLSVLTVILCQQTCNFTLTNEDVIQIRQIIGKSTHVRLVVHDYVEKNLTNLHYFISKTTSLFLLEPSASFFTFGLISKDFYVLDIKIKGSFCDITNGRDTKLPFQKDELFMAEIFNTSVRAYTDKNFFICAEEYGYIPISQSSNFQSFFEVNREKYLCCDKTSCSVKNEPFVNQVCEWVLDILALVLTALFVKVILSRISEFHKKNEYSEYLTDNFHSPVSAFTIFFPRLRILPKTGILLIQLTFLLTTLFLISFIFPFAPSYWPTGRNIVEFDVLGGVTLILSFMCVIAFTLIKAYFSLLSIEKNPKTPEILFKGISIITYAVIVNIVWFFILEDYRFSISKTTQTCLRIIGTLFFYSTINYYKVWNRHLPFEMDEEKRETIHYFLNICLSCIIESTFLFVSVNIAFFASSVITKIIWYNMVSIILYPSNIAIYSAGLAIIFIIYDYLNKICEPYYKLKELLVKKCTKRVKDIQNGDSIVYESVNKEEEVALSTEKKLVPISWKIYFRFADEINFKTIEHSALRQTIFQIAILSIFFLGIVVFVPDTYDGILQIGLTVVLPIIPKISGVILGYSISSFETSIYEERFNQAWKKFEDKREDGKMIELYVIHEKVNKEFISV